MSGPQEVVLTRHTGRFGGRDVDYTAAVKPTTVGPLGQDGPTASIVSIEYIAQVPGRPVVFLCNGGPIVPSVALHMGAFGPRRVSYSGGGNIDNEYSLLDVADLVFYDPPGTGYSRVADGTDPAAFASVNQDASLMAAWIRQWLDENDRAESPVFLVGESYGTIRVAVVAADLAASGVHLAGVCLVSQATDIIETSQRPANLMSYVVSLPTLAAVAWHHERVERRGRPLSEVIRETSEFSVTEYFPALLKGPRLSATDRDRVAHRLAELTGVPAATWLDRQLRLTKHEFRVELLADRNLVLHMYDARLAGPPRPAFPPGSIPARMLGIQPEGTDTTEQAIGGAIEPHLRDFLKVGWDAEYRPRAPELGAAWSWAATNSPFGDWPYGRTLAEAMAVLPKMRLLVCTGIYDMSTTIGAAEHAASACGWPPERVQLEHYEGGHMMYSVPASLTALAADMRALIGGGA